MRSYRPTPNDAFRPLFLLWAAISLGLLVSILYIGFYDLSNPTLIDYGEGPLMWQAANLFNPTHAYALLDNGPLVIWNYTPGYLFAVRALSNWQGDFLWSGRFVSLFCGLGVVTLLFTITYRALPQRFGARIRLCASGTGLLFLTSASSVAWFPLMRVDWQGLFLAYLGLFFFLSARTAPWKTVPAFLCFILAILTKQTFLAAPLSCVIVMLVTAPLRALRAVLICVAVGIFTFWLGMHWTHGGFLRHLVTYNVHKFSIHRAVAGIWLAMLDVRLLFLPVVGLAVLTFMRQWSSARWRAAKLLLLKRPLFLTLTLESIHLLLSFAMAFTFGKIGSNLNYFLEWTAALCSVAGISIGLALWHALRSRRLTPLTAGALAFPVLLAVFAFDQPLYKLIGARSVRAQERSSLLDYNRVIPLLEATPGPILSDDTVLLLRARKDIVFDPVGLYYMALAGTWDQEPFLNRVKAREFPLVIISSPILWHPAVLEAIHQNYQLDRVDGQFQVYRPRTSESND
jgi:hypothetical protein